MAKLITKRGGYWHYVRRVPRALAEVDPRGIIFQSTKIRILDDPRGTAALRVAQGIDTEVEAYWSALKDGRSADAQARYEAARKRARVAGFDYAPAEELAGRPLGELVARLEALIAAREGANGLVAVEGLLGGAEKPVHRLSTLFETYEGLQQASLADLSEDQRRKWGNPKKKAISNLIGVIGDKEISRISRSDAIDFRAWWSERVVAGAARIDTANKDFGHVATMIRALDTAYTLGLPLVFAGLRIAGGQTGQRTAFLPEFVQSKMLSGDALAGLNPEARRILYLVSETGLRLSEACNLTGSTIILDADVPHIVVAAEGRRMKTPHSGRAIPLVGVALMAMQAQPGGFPRYRDKSAGLSAVINKYLGEHGLRPTDGHSAYSLRHTFEDRLTAVNAPDKIIAVLMGHQHQRPKYGLGPTLELKREWLDKIAFSVSDDFCL